MLMLRDGQRPNCGHSRLAIGIPIPAIHSSEPLAEIAARCRHHGSAFPEKIEKPQSLGIPNIPFHAAKDEDYSNPVHVPPSRCPPCGAL